MNNFYRMKSELDEMVAMIPFIFLVVSTNAFAKKKGFN